MRAFVREWGRFGNIFAHSFRLRSAEDEEQWHRHHFDHVTLVAKGSVHFSWRDDNGNTGHADCIAPAFIEVPKDRHHHFRALVDDTMCWCIFAIQPDGSGWSGEVPEGECPGYACDVCKAQENA